MMPKRKEKDEVILIRVKPQTVRKLQADVIALKQNNSDKQTTINKLQEDITILKEKMDKLEKIKS